MNVQDTLTEDKKFALRGVISFGLGTASICCELNDLKLYSLSSWLKCYRLVKTVGVFTRWFQRLAFFSAINFDGFDEASYWQEYELLCKKFPYNPFIMTRQFYEQDLQRIVAKSVD